jgi:drug/metabolite transporter (DMT)-like permease
MKTKDWFVFLLLGVIWGSSFLWIKIAVQEITPILLVSFRLLFGAIGLGFAALFFRPEWPHQRRIWLFLVLFGFTNSAIPYILISWGEQFIDSGVAAILNSTTPLFTMIIAHFFLHDDRITPARLGGLLIGFFGIVILVSRDIQPGMHFNILGQVAVLIASVLYAGSSVLARRTTRGIQPIVQGLIPLPGADAVLWFTTLAFFRPITLPRLPITWVAIIWLGLLGTAVAFLLYFYLLNSVGPTRTTLVTYVFPLVGVILGVVLLKETLNWQLILGGSLVVSSIIVVNRKSSKSIIGR